MKRAAALVTMAIFLFPMFLYAEAPAPENAAGPNEEMRFQLAQSTQDYPVTPGDSYLISYMTMNGAQSYEITIRGDYQANLGIFGYLQTRGMTYLAFAQAVEQKVSAVYPQGRPQCMIRRTGIFTVSVQGEVKLARVIECWGLSTLSGVVLNNGTPNASIRKVDVSSADGTARSYDLFLSQRTGSRAFDPYVRPGDVITLGKIIKQVSISGEVYRPGEYELLPGEGLGALVEKYGDGFTVLGDVARIRIVRTISTAKANGETFDVDGKSPEFKNFSLENLDAVYVASRMDSFPVVHFEGAVETGKAADASASGEPSPGKYTQRITEGERLSNVVRGMQQVFSPFASLSDAAIIRRGQDRIIPVNIEKLIYAYAQADDVILQPQDRIIIPFKKYYVTVSGAVLKPGRYLYAPGKSYSYYLDLAGGADPQKNSGSSVIIYDANENKQQADRAIQPDDRIFAEYNNGLYHFQQWGVILGTTVSIAALVVSIIQLTR